MYFIYLYDIICHLTEHCDIQTRTISTYSGILQEATWSLQVYSILRMPVRDCVDRQLHNGADVVDVRGEWCVTRGVREGSTRGVVKWRERREALSCGGRDCERHRGVELVKFRHFAVFALRCRILKRKAPDKGRPQNLLKYGFSPRSTDRFLTVGAR